MFTLSMVFSDVPAAASTFPLPSINLKVQPGFGWFVVMIVVFLGDRAMKTFKRQTFSKVLKRLDKITITKVQKRQASLHKKRKKVVWRLAYNHVIFVFHFNIEYCQY